MGGYVEGMGEPARESGREIANFRVKCVLVQSAQVGNRTFLTYPLTRRGGRVKDDDRFSDDVLALEA